MRNINRGDMELRGLELSDESREREKVWVVPGNKS
jgi:hypothetical protein